MTLAFIAPDANTLNSHTFQEHSSLAEIFELSATAMAAHVRQKKISPVDLVRIHLDRISALNPQLNAYISLRPEEALADARRAEEAIMRGNSLGPLHGVPISIKSSVSVKGLAFECGSRSRLGLKGTEDAPLVARLKASGAIVLGATNVPEMLMNYFTDNAIYGRTNSPFDLARSPGGSSGGEAAAISACISAAGIGSDGGGSIRYPAHCCGIFGLKPTPGRVPITGHYPESGGPFAAMGVVGPMARSADDIETMFSITAGFDYLDPIAAPIETRSPDLASLRGLRIGYFEDDGVTPVTPETAAAVRAAAEALRSDGFDIRPFRPKRIANARENWLVFFVLCGGAVLQPMLDADPDQVSEGLKEFLGIAHASTPLTRDLLLNSWFARDAIRLDILREMQDYPILLSPVASMPAFRHGERRWKIGDKEVDYLDTFAYSQWLNGIGFPGISVPVGRSPQGLPIGVQLIARPYEDEVAIGIAKVLEKSFGWMKPTLAWANTQASHSATF
jgi:Asp-tRNA(Asn)/Glu-tRNA(Gln) amidotransferase A subunit family amidase